MAERCVFLMENINADAMKELNPDYFVNLGSGIDIKIKDLAQLLKNIVGFEGNIKYDNAKPGGTKRKLLDINLIRNLGFQVNYNLEEGLFKIYEWYKNKIC